MSRSIPESPLTRHKEQLAMSRQPYKPLYPDEPGDHVYLIPGTKRKYAATKNGNIYLMNGREVLSEYDRPLKPEMPNAWRELARVRVRLSSDPPFPKRPWHSVAYLVLRTFRRGEYPATEDGKWRIYNQNANPADCRLKNLDCKAVNGNQRRNRLCRAEREIAQFVLSHAKSENFQFHDIARAFNVEKSYMRKLLSRMANKAREKRRDTE